MGIGSLACLTSLHSDAGQCQDKGSAFGGRFDFDSASMLLDDLLGDG